MADFWFIPEAVSLSSTINFLKPYDLAIPLFRSLTISLLRSFSGAFTVWIRLFCYSFPGVFHMVPVFSLQFTPDTVSFLVCLRFGFGGFVQHTSGRPRVFFMVYPRRYEIPTILR